VPDGGWFRWVEKPDQSTQVNALFQQYARLQIQDLPEAQKNDLENWRVTVQDARTLDGIEDEFDALITSPPYPNRHDYSRIFHIELLSLGISEDEIFKLRFASIRSHVEARGVRSNLSGYTLPRALQDCLDALPTKSDVRIPEMLRGYFEDMYLCLRAAYWRLKPGALAAFVVGNVRHAGVMIPVDEILAQVGQQIGFGLETGWVARLRGNSAQQMGVYGREPARETVVFLRK